jgi:hypothetical protein
MTRSVTACTGYHHPSITLASGSHDGVHSTPELGRSQDLASDEAQWLGKLLVTLGRSDD